MFCFNVLGPEHWKAARLQCFGQSATRYMYLIPLGGFVHPKSLKFITVFCLFTHYFPFRAAKGRKTTATYNHFGVLSLNINTHAYAA